MAQSFKDEVRARLSAIEQNLQIIATHLGVDLIEPGAAKPPEVFDLSDQFVMATDGRFWPAGSVPAAAVADQ
jgi:hypothetical protein